MPYTFTPAAKDPATPAYTTYSVRHDLHVNDAQTALTRMSAGVFYLADYGAVGNGVADDTTALQAAIDACSAAKGVLVFAPNKTYGTSLPVDFKSDITVLAYGSRIKALAAHMADTTSRVCRIRPGNGNIKIYGLEIDGSHLTGGGTNSEFKAGLEIDAAHDVLVKDCWMHHCRGDGLFISDSFATSAWGNQHNANIIVEDCRLEDNNRNNMALSDGLHIVIRGCVFLRAVGMLPRAGLDIEWHSTESRLENVSIEGCDFRDNTTYGVQLGTVLTTATVERVADIRFTNCNMTGNGMGLNVQHARSVTFTACEIRNNGHGVTLDWDIRDIQFIGGSISENLRWGVIGQDNTANGAIIGAKFIGVEFYNNSRTTPNSDQAVLLYGLFDDLTFMGCRFNGSHSIGLSLSASTITRTKLIGNDFTGNVAAVSLGDDGATRKAIGNSGYNPVGVLGPPSVPATTVAYTNAYGVDATVYITGGTVTAIAIAGTATGLTSGSFRVAAGQTITLTYSVAPTWQWRGN